MSHDEVFPAALLRRKAVVYVRQSTTQQVHNNLESQRRQYELVEKARHRGGPGSSDRFPGFLSGAVLPG
jgi:hypothetical protein